MVIKGKPKKGINVNMAMVIVCMVTFVSFLPLFRNNYVHWDDPEYILHNPLMNASLKTVFTSYYLGNYHPLTILVLTLEHKFFGSEIMGYHGVNLLLHLLNCLLVFYFVYLLFDKKNILVPFITSILFGIHPMHVESIAWTSELKDVLYSFFFLSSLGCYILYAKEGQKLFFIIIAFVLFILSLLSKGQAVTLPFCFLLIDYFIKRKEYIKMFMEKLPFFALSVIFSIVAVKAQSTAVYNPITGFSNIFWGFYALCLYLLKFILPIHLSGLYPYPYTPDHSMPTYIYFTPAIIIAFLMAVFIFYRRNRYVVFGVLFFFVNIITVIKFIPVGDAIIADRYSYIAYIGFFFIAGYGFNRLMNLPVDNVTKNIIQYAGIFLILLLSALSWSRITVWKDTFSFWGDVSKNYKDYWRSYLCMGQEYYDLGNYTSAIASFSQGITNDKYCPPTVYVWRGFTYLEKIHNNDSAIADFKKVLAFPNKTDASQFEGRLDLGLAYYRKGKFDDALKNYNELIAMNPGEKKAYYMRGLVYNFSNHPQIDSALAGYNKAIQMDANYEDAILSRGNLYVDFLGKYNEGIADFNKVLELDPGNTDAIMNKGVAYSKNGKYDEALKNFNLILEKEPKNGKLYFCIALAWSGKNDYAKAIQLAQQARQLGYPFDARILDDWKLKKSGHKS